MHESNTPTTRAIADSAKAFAKELKHGYVGREHQLYAFATGAGGDSIRVAFEACGLSESKVRAAIDFVDGGMHPHPHIRQRVISPLLAHHHMGEKVPMAQIAQLGVLDLTPNAQTVLTMSIKEAQERGAVVPSFQDVLFVFLREVGRSDDDRRVMRVIEHAVPNLDLNDIEWAVKQVVANAPIEQVDRQIAQQEQRVRVMKRVRHALMFDPNAVQTA